MRLIGTAHYLQLMEWQNSGITRLQHGICAPNAFLRVAENQITTNYI